MPWKKLNDTELDKIHEYSDDTRLWDPVPGDTIEGKVIKLKKGKYDKYFMIIEEEDGERWMTTQCNSLDEQIKRIQVIEGDTVQLTYYGKKEGNMGAHNYLLQIWEDE